ncbi:hypothetical protein CDL15_Pgr019182 [Punica granatum]|uniref:Uncharacterized protein n=1 Tax=Punica granatum TaxID=22663 RepID=A0A218W622_PUNGR|nr:hypothetical protein CDL15_Pgr019182 [Punica granatum]
MESSSSPSSKDNEKTKTTVTEADDEPNYHSLGSPSRNLLQEAVMAILRCLGFERENATAQVVESGSTRSVAEKESEGKERDSSSSPQPKEEGGKGDGGAASAILSVLPRSLPAHDPPSTATSQVQP